MFKYFDYAWDLSLKNSAGSYLCSQLALLHSVSYFFFLYWSPSSLLCMDFYSISSNNSHSSALLDLFVSSDASICSTTTFTPLGNSDHVVVSVLIDNSSNSKQDAVSLYSLWLFSCRWVVFVIIWEIIHGKISFKFGASAAFSEFCGWVQVGIDVYISHCKYQVKSHYLCGFQLLLQLPQFIEITFFVCTNRINLLNLK